MGIFSIFKKKKSELPPLSKAEAEKILVEGKWWGKRNVEEAKRILAGYYECNIEDIDYDPGDLTTDGDLTRARDKILEERDIQNKARLRELGRLQAQEEHRKRKKQ